MAKAKKAVKKRKASKAQLAALARGRRKAAANRKTASPKKTKPRKKSSSRVLTIKENKPMARRKSSKAVAKTTTRRKSSGRANFLKGKAKGMIPIMKDVAVAVGGGVAGGVLANKLPIANPKLKAAIPLVAGIVLAATLGQKKRSMHELGTGMAVIGAIALLRQFAPNIPMLAGEDDVFIAPPGYGGDMMRLGYDDDDNGQMGDMFNLGDDQEEYISAANL
jgi:hypothetical protein